MRPVKIKHPGIKLGVVTNELFTKELGRMGGFGWATRQVSHYFSQDPSLGVQVSLIMGEWLESEAEVPATIHGSPVIWRDKRIFAYQAHLRRMHFDALLAIDYRPNYRLPFLLLPRTPILFWIRDPRNSEDIERIRTLRIPGAGDYIPHGAIPPKTDSLSQVCRMSHWLRRPLRFAATSPHLIPKISGCYGIKIPSVDILPNIIDIRVPDTQKSKDPLVVFLGRLDPIKRPWIFAELGKKFPDVQFLFLGQKHFSGPGSWDEGNLAENVRMMGHVGELQKERLLKSAWALVNTSIHEGLSISFLEALACETPIISSVDPDGIVSRFGICVGDWPGTGLAGLLSFENALSRLLDDGPLRERLGREGRDWVSLHHNRDIFLDSFRKIAGSMNRLLHEWANSR
jgi:glycosyltransferase involved in cell wall biosynthesis